MSVIVKTMDMPKSCAECPLNVGEYEIENYEKRYCAITYHEMRKSDYKRRPKDCPLEEVPRCKDCARNPNSGKARTICPCPMDRYMGPEGYCSKAEPKEEPDVSKM